MKELNRICFLILILISISFSVKADAYSRGGYAQLYWDWRPDIADSCYEFTYIRYVEQQLTPTQYSSMINLFYWDDCNYGLNWINADFLSSTYSNMPLHDTLFRTTLSPHGTKDTICGFNSPLMRLNFAQNPTPLRDKIVYKGLIFLPEKCKDWHFALGPVWDIPGTSGLNSEAVFLYCNKSIALSPDPVYVNTLSNIDSIGYNPYLHNMYTNSAYLKGVLCARMNNVDFPNNSSVRFLSPALTSFQVQKNVEFNPSPFDPDHDNYSISLTDTFKNTQGIWTIGGSGGFSYSFFNKNDYLGFPMNGPYTLNMLYAPLPGQTGPNPIRFNPINNPFDTDSTFHLVDSTGKTTFKASSVTEPVLMYIAKEYRDGKFLSETYCVNQFTVLADGRLPSFMKLDTAHVQNINFNSEGTMLACAGGSLSFDAFIKLPGGGDLEVRNTADTTVPGNAICTMTGLHTDSVHLNFSWIPPAGTRGLYNVFVIAKDSNCNPPFHHYTQVYTWSFYIDTCNNVSASTISADEQIHIYPNPTTNQIRIESEQRFSNIKLFNLSSQLIKEATIKECANYNFDLGNISSGMYFIVLDDKWIRKIVIE